METETREFSVTNVLSYLEKNNQKIATDTLYRYVEAICSTFIMNRVYRYDIHGKSVLKTLNKFYAVETNSKEVNYSHALENIVYENIVYNELVNKEYDVYIGKTKLVRLILLLLMIKN